jgi:hypothetical protein
MTTLKQGGTGVAAVNFSEETILPKQADTFPVVRHIRLSGTQREIGNRLAQLARERYNVRLNNNPSPDYGRARYEYIKKNYPGLMERARGVMDAYNLKDDDPSVDATVLAYSAIDFGCSVVYLPPSFTESGHAMSVRNMDDASGSLSEMMGKPRHAGETDLFSEIYVFAIHPEDGYASLFNSTMDLLGDAIDGVNEHGLSLYGLVDRGVPMNMVRPSGSRDIGLNEFQAARMVLETCRNCEEAKIAMLTSKIFFVVEGLHFLVSDASGNSFVWEVNQADGQAYIQDGGGKPHVLTNNPIWQMPPPDKWPQKFDDPYDPLNRYRILAEAITANGNNKFSEAWMINASESVFPKKPSSALGGPKVLLRPLWNVIYDITARTMKARYWLKDNGLDHDGNPRLVMSDWFNFKLD